MKKFLAIDIGGTMLKYAHVLEVDECRYNG